LKILLIKPSSLGDVVHALPTANLLRKHFPDAHLSWLVNDTLVGLLKNCPVINSIIPFYRERFASPTKLREFFRYLGKLRDQRFDMAIDLQGLFRSGMLAKASGAPRRIGLSDAREGARWFCNETVVVPRECRHAVDRYLQTIAHLGFGIGPIEFPFGSSEQEKGEVDAFLGELDATKSPLIGLCPGARWDNKRWPAASYGELVRELTREWKPHRVVLIGGGREEIYLHAIAELSESAPVIMAGKLTLSGLIELLRRCSLFFGNDTGPTHIASALGVPTVEIFGPTNPVLTGPHASQTKHTTVLRKELPCSPCLKPSCANKVELECLKMISVREVLSAGEKLMDRSVSRS
jgi:lipopolysaccharide heptosyltransferase I